MCFPLRALDVRERNLAPAVRFAERVTMAPTEVAAAALAAVLMLLLMVLVAFARKWWRSFRARFRGRRAHRRESDAETLLRKQGYAIEGTQVQRTWLVSCDGEDTPIELRADYLVTRGMRRFVADVKTGSRATKLTTAATRRQLLEYRIAYDVSGVLLVDMDEERIREVNFQLP